MELRPRIKAISTEDSIFLPRRPQSRNGTRQGSTRFRPRVRIPKSTNLFPLFQSIISEWNGVPPSRSSRLRRFPTKNTGSTPWPFRKPPDRESISVSIFRMRSNPGETTADSRGRGWPRRISSPTASSGPEPSRGHGGQGKKSPKHFVDPLEFEPIFAGKSVPASPNRRRIGCGPVRSRMDRSGSG